MPYQKTPSQLIRDQQASPPAPPPAPPREEEPTEEEELRPAADYSVRLYPPKQMIEEGWTYGDQVARSEYDPILVNGADVDDLLNIGFRRDPPPQQ